MSCIWRAEVGMAERKVDEIDADERCTGTGRIKMLGVWMGYRVWKWRGGRGRRRGLRRLRRWLGRWRGSCRMRGGGNGTCAALRGFGR